MVVSLYTSRVVLNALGVTDFGIYNVVGGVVTMFTFLNTAMSSGTQRFLNFELAKNNHLQLNRVFSMSLSIHVMIAIIIFVLAETVGLWFVNTQMTIPDNRIEAANWIYQFSVLSMMILLTQVPYTASIIAHERMDAYAYIGIAEVFLRLFAVIALTWILADKLKAYAVLTFLVTVTITLCYRIYCKRNFAECTFKLTKDKALFKTLTGFASWNLFGSITLMLNTQGQNILLNIFFGPAINAARGLAFQANNAISSLVNNFQTAVNPQIVKSYATGDYQYFESLIFRSTKFSFFLLLICVAPILVETEYILTLWLKIVPEYSVIFFRLILIGSLLDSFSNPLTMASSASGRIKLYQACVGGLTLLNIPLAYVALKMGFSATSVFIIAILIIGFALIVRLFILRKIVSLNVKSFSVEVLFRSAISFILILAPAFFIKAMLSDGFWQFISVTIITLALSALVIIYVGMKKNERAFVLNKLSSIIRKVIRK